MRTTIRDLDEKTYRALEARAAQKGMTMGDAVNAAIRCYLAMPESAKEGSLIDLEPDAWRQGSERLSEEINVVVYGGWVHSDRPGKGVDRSG